MTVLRFTATPLLTAALIALSPAVMADEIDEAKAYVAGKCPSEIEKPSMPDPEKATKEEAEATYKSIKSYQEALGGHRECLDALIEDKDLDREQRQAALDTYNATVDEETAVVESWAKFYEAYKKARKDKEEG